MKSFISLSFDSELCNKPYTKISCNKHSPPNESAAMFERWFFDIGLRYHLGATPYVFHLGLISLTVELVLHRHNQKNALLYCSTLDINIFSLGR